MKIGKQNLLINVFDSLPFYLNYDNSNPCKKLSKITYNMTITPKKVFFSKFWFLSLSKSRFTVLVGAIPEKFSKRKNLYFSQLLIKLYIN